MTTDTDTPVISAHDRRLAQELLATADSLTYCIQRVDELRAQSHRAAVACEAMADNICLYGPTVRSALRLLAVALDGDALRT